MDVGCQVPLRMTENPQEPSGTSRNPQEPSGTLRSQGSRLTDWCRWYQVCVRAGVITRQRPAPFVLASPLVGVSLFVAFISSCMMWRKNIIFGVFLSGCFMLGRLWKHHLPVTCVLCRCCCCFRGSRQVSVPPPSESCSPPQGPRQ